MRKIHYLAALALTIGATSAQALPTPNGSFGGAQFGTVTAVSTGTWQLGAGTSRITVTRNHFISSYLDTYLGKQNNLSAENGSGGSVSEGDRFTLSNNTFDVFNGALASPLVLQMGTYTFNFTSENVTSQVDGNIGLSFLGNLLSDSSGNLETPAAASFSATFTQSAKTSAIAAAYSIDTPPELAQVPEPATLGLMGLGLGLVAASRRRKAA